MSLLLSQLDDCEPTDLCDCCGFEIAEGEMMSCPNGKQICRECFNDGFDGDTMPSDQDSDYPD